MTDTFAPCVPNTGAGANNSSPPSPGVADDDGDGDACGATRDAELAGGQESALCRQRAWRRLGVEGLDLYRHPETDSRARRLVIGYASPAPSAWSAALDALTGQLP